MNRLWIYLLFALFLVGCNAEEEDPPCESFSAAAPCEWAITEMAYMNMPRPADSYNFPVCPGMEGWFTPDVVNKSYQIPECVLKKMSTQAVIQAVLEHPNYVLTALGLSSTELKDEVYFEKGFCYSWSANLELSKRKDAGVALLERLRLMNPIAHIAFMRQSEGFEWLLGHRIFLSQLKDVQKREIVEICLRNDALRLQEMRLLGRCTAFVLIGRTMLAAKYDPLIKAMNDDVQLKNFITGSIIAEGKVNIDHGLTIENIEIIQSIIGLAKKYINQK